MELKENCKEKSKIMEDIVKTTTSTPLSAQAVDVDAESNTVAATANIRTKDNTKIPTTTSATAISQDNANLEKGKDISAPEITAKGGGADENKMTKKGIMTTITTTPPAQSNTVIPIISLSDDETTTITVTASAAIPLQKTAKKRRSLGASSGERDVEQRYRLKRRKIKVAGAPKMPLTGYVRYMNDRRETLRKEHPSKSAIEHTKMIGEEWHRLPEDRRAPYMEAAEIDKKRYTTELDTFLKENPDVLASEIAKNKARKSNGSTADANGPAGAGKAVLKEKTQQLNGNAGAKITQELIKETKSTRAAGASSNSDKDVSPPPPPPPPAPAPAAKRKRTPTPNNSNSSSNNAAIASASNATNAQPTATTAPLTLSAPVPGAIPIFTPDFLEHNKHFDMELRTLRKSKADLEQQNAVLERHVENMKFGVNKLETENNELQEKTRLLEIYVNKLKRKLVSALSTLPIPSEPNGATIENIEKYMNDLYKMATSNTHGPASLNKAKDIIRKLDLQIQL